VENLKVWEGLARLDAVADQVRAGRYVQPVYQIASIYRLDQAVEQLPEATALEPIPVMPTKSGLPTLDYEALAAQLKGLVF
jgi:hypothetical protein